jgi:hypothetical protein
LRTPVTAIAPSSWASYLINGDATGISDSDRQAADAWVKRQNMGAAASCDDYGFTRWHDALEECPFGADCQTYTFLVETNEVAA